MPPRNARVPSHQRAVKTKLLRRGWCLRRIPNRSVRAAEVAARVAAVVGPAVAVEPAEPEEPEAAAALVEPEALVEREAVAGPAAPEERAVEVVQVEVERGRRVRR